RLSGRCRCSACLVSAVVIGELASRDLIDVASLTVPDHYCLLEVLLHAVATMGIERVDGCRSGDLGRERHILRVPATSHKMLYAVNDGAFALGAEELLTIHLPASGNTSREGHSLILIWIAHARIEIRMALQVCPQFLPGVGPWAAGSVDGVDSIVTGNAAMGIRGAASNAMPAADICHQAEGRGLLRGGERIAIVCLMLHLL